MRGRLPINEFIVPPVVSTSNLTGSISVLSNKFDPVGGPELSTDDASRGFHPRLMTFGPFGAGPPLVRPSDKP